MSTVLSLSQSCIEGFQDLLSSLGGTAPRFLQQMPPSTIEIQLGKFRIWCGNLGALQTGYSSLDYRLRESALMHNNISQLIQQLGVALEESTAIVSGERPPFDEESIPSDISEESDDDTSNDYFSSTELSMRVSSITDILNNLYRLSYKIRNTALRPSSTRAHLIQAVDNETGIDLFDTLHEFDSRHLIELFTAMRQGKSEDNGFSDALLQRLTKANVLRRKQFRYWERHARKLGVQVLPVHQIPIIERPSTSEAPEDVGFRQAQRLEVAPPVEEQSHLSGTNATPYDPALDDRTERQTILSLASTALDADGKGIEVPKPPEEALNGDSFTCPYCWVVCPPKEGRGKTWKSHVLHDLRPYVCTYETCNLANDLYQSRKAWVDHEEAVHRPSWRCRDHPDTLYVACADFKRHLLREHDRGLSGEQLEDLTNVSKLGRVDDRDVCPICFEEQPFPKGLTNHLANHLERIALFALPTTIGSDEKNLDESQFSKLFNIDPDDSSTSEQFEEDEEDLTDTHWNMSEYAPDPSTTMTYTAEIGELHAVLGYYVRVFLSLNSSIFAISLTLGGHDKFAFELSLTNVERCLAVTQKVLERILIVHLTPQNENGDSLTEMLKDVQKFLDTTAIELLKVDEGSLEDHEKQIALVTEAIGGLGTVHDILERVLQVLGGSISFTTGLNIIRDYQSILTTLLPTGVETASSLRDTRHMTKSIEQPPDMTHETAEAPGYGETLEASIFDEISEDPEYDEMLEGHEYQESLDPRYRTAFSRMFQPGEVFKTLWPEPAPETPYTGEQTLYRDQYGASILVNFRRFIVVANDRGHCTCVPMTTYGKQGLKKKGVDPKSHGIVCESGNRSPQLLQGEPTPGFTPVHVDIYVEGERIDKAARVCYAKLMTVEHGLKVFFIGRVVAADLDSISSAVDACWEKKDHMRRRRRR